MPECTDETVQFGRVGRRVAEAALGGGDIVSDGGVLLLKQVDARLGLTHAAAQAFGDERRSASFQHSVHSPLAQRIYGLCLGWSDVCDHNVLRSDLVMQTAVGRDQPLGSAPTLSRLETGATPVHAAAPHEVLMQQFIASHDKASKEVVLDVDATHVPLHGERERELPGPGSTTLPQLPSSLDTDENLEQGAASPRSGVLADAGLGIRSPQIEVCGLAGRCEEASR